MNESIVAEPSAVPAVAPDTTIVDCDFHPFVPVSEIHARMSARARRHANIGSAAVPAREHNRFLHPTGPLRLDAVPPGGGLAGSDPDFAITDYLDRYGISLGMICSTQSHAVVSWADDQAVCEYLRAINDLFLELWHRRDHRFRLLLCVSPHNPDAAIAEMERLAGEPGVIGVHLPSAELSLGSMPLRRFYEAAAYHRLPLCLHPNGSEGAFANSPTHAGSITRSFAERHANLAQSGQGQLVSLVMSGALAKIPDLRVMLAEFGFSWVGPVMWRMDEAWQRNGGADGVLDEPPSQYVMRQVCFTTQPFDEPERPSHVLPLLDAMQAERTLVFSSDHPHWDTDDPPHVLAHRIPETLRRRVAYENAAAHFGERLWL